MTNTQLLGLRLISFLIVAPLLGYFLVYLIDQTLEAWKSNNRRKKWIAMSTVAGFYLALTGWFRNS